MPLFTGDLICADLGSSFTTVVLGNVGAVLKEPTKVLTLEEDTQSVLAIGIDAQMMLGKTAGDSTIHSPVLDGAITDTDMVALLLLALAEKATGRKRPMDKARFAVSMSQGLTKVEKAALKQASRQTGAKRPILIRTPMAAATGAGADVSSPRGTMTMVLGGGTTEIAVLAMNSVIAARTIRSAGLSMDEAIVRYIRREKGLIIGLRTAEDIKCDIGSAIEPEDGDGESVLLKGKNAVTGKPETISVTTRDVAKALRQSIDLLVDAMRDALSRTPTELSGDILEDGVHLCGGGALLSGLAQLLASETGVPFTVSEHPQDDVALGLSRIAEDDKILNDALDFGSAEDI